MSNETDANHPIDIQTAEMGIADIMRIRIEELPKAEGQHAHQNQRLLKHAVEPLNSMQIFPTAQISRNTPAGKTEIVKENLLFVTSVQEGPSYLRADYFLTPGGELVAYSKVGDCHVRIDSATDKIYIQQADNALRAIEGTIRSAMGTQNSQD